MTPECATPSSSTPASAGWPGSFCCWRNFGKEGRPETVLPKISQETLAEMVGTTRSRISFFMNKFRKLGFVMYKGGLEVHSSPPQRSFSMNPPLTRGRVRAACGIAILSLALLVAPAAADRGADRQPREGQLLFWLLGLTVAREHERPRIDVNSATLEDLQGVPGMERHQALRIVAQRPYATLQDLARADLSPTTIERLARFLVVGPDWPSALPGRARTPGSR